MAVPASSPGISCSCTRRSFVVLNKGQKQPAGNPDSGIGHGYLGRFRASSSSSVRGQSAPSSRDKLRSAKTFPPVWQRAQ